MKNYLKLLASGKNQSVSGYSCAKCGRDKEASRKLNNQIVRSIPSCVFDLQGRIHNTQRLLKFVANFLIDEKYKDYLSLDGDKELAEIASEIGLMVHHQVELDSDDNPCRDEWFAATPAWVVDYHLSGGQWEYAD